MRFSSLYSHGSGSSIGIQNGTGTVGANGTAEYISQTYLLADADSTSGFAVANSESTNAVGMLDSSLSVGNNATINVILNGAVPQPVLGGGTDATTGASVGDQLVDGSGSSAPRLVTSRRLGRVLVRAPMTTLLAGPQRLVAALARLNNWSCCCRFWLLRY